VVDASTGYHHASTGFHNRMRDVLIRVLRDGLERVS